jgi:FSR family fosmidomycin resistance protein-like MFS transporter
LFGFLADRASVRWLLPISVLFTGVGLAIGSQSSNYAFFFIALIVSGLGVAAFHPEAARLVHRVARPGRATEMSVFAVGGNIGFAMAPLLTAALMLTMGRPGTLLVVLPTGILVVLLALQFSTSTAAVPTLGRQEGGLAERNGNGFGFLTLCAVTICRSTLFVGFNTFLALYWMSRWSVSPSTGATVLAVFIGIGVAGTLLGGWLADRWGWRAMLRAGFGTAAVLLPLLLAMPDTVSATLVLVSLAVAFYIPSSVLVVLGQAYLPHRVGVASGVTLGLGVSAGGMVAPLLGVVADHHGVEAVLLVLEAVLVAALLLSLALPQVPRLLQLEDTGRGQDEVPTAETKVTAGL